MNLHDIGPTSSIIARLRRGQECGPGCRSPGEPSAHHQCFFTRDHIQVYYCLCMTPGCNHATGGTYHYFERPRRSADMTCPHCREGNHDS